MAFSETRPVTAATMADLENDPTDDGIPLMGIPNEAELTLLCLDYLRDLRRAYPPAVLRDLEGLDADYLTLACWALNRAFVAPPHMTAQRGNDAYFECEHKPMDVRKSLPKLEDMEKEVVYDENPFDHEDQKKEEDHDYQWYEYDDAHPSNSHRFYPLSGLASGPALRGPLTLGEIAAAGLAGLGARSRLEAERDMVETDLFMQFVHAVKEKGFFDDDEDDDEGPEEDEEARQRRKDQIYEDRYRKVVAKFRTKLASKADADTMGDLMAHSAAEQQRQRRAARIQAALSGVTMEHEDPIPKREDPPTPSSYQRQRTFFGQNYSPKADHGHGDQSVFSNNPVDLDEAEKLKGQGNTHMQRKEFQLAADCYTKALQISPSGPQSHVYFSNRAAALVSMKRFHEAIADSERSLALKPDYGKAHARLGLSHFLLGNYRPAMEAYTVSLKYDPDNKSSKNYLDKAAKRLAEVGETAATPMSYSVVSEWDKNKKASDEASSEREAERYKARGNSYMSARDYDAAMKAYTQAIELSPHGSQSHVYYSNRAAALCYLERYQEAEADSIKSLSLNPSYGKAHARLGLSRFFLQKYAGAVDAYTSALKYDPDNSASKSYLAKAKAKLEASSDATARRMMQDPEMRHLAAKVMAAGADSRELLNDPETQNLAKKALHDPSILAALTRK